MTESTRPDTIVDWERISVPATQLLELIPDFIGVADPQGRLLYINRSGRRMVGLGPADDASDHWIHDFFPDWSVGQLQLSGNGNGNGAAYSQKWVDWTPRGRLRTCDGRELSAAHAVIAHTGEQAEITCFTILARGAFRPEEVHARLQVVDLERALNEILALARTAVESSVTIRESLESQGAKVLADPTQIHQVLLNLCLDAARSMGEVGGEIVVKTSRVTVKGPDVPGVGSLRAGTYVRLTIRDNGPGIEPSIATHIFEPSVAGGFYDEGTSSGLWTMKRTVVDSGGDIFVESTPGRGTAFHVYLPVVGSNGHGPSP